MRQPVAANGIRQRLDHRFLPDQLAEGLRTILAREHAIGLRGINWSRLSGGRLGRLFAGCSSGIGRSERFFGRIAEHRILPRSFQLGGGGGFCFAIWQIGIGHEHPI